MERGRGKGGAGQGKDLDLFEQRRFLDAEFLVAESFVLHLEPLRFHLPPLELIRQRHQAALHVAHVRGRLCHRQSKQQENSASIPAMLPLANLNNTIIIKTILQDRDTWFAFLD